jgi:hypothetical protein
MGTSGNIDTLAASGFAATSKFLAADASRVNSVALVAEPTFDITLTVVGDYIISGVLLMTCASNARDMRFNPTFSGTLDAVYSSFSTTALTPNASQVDSPSPSRAAIAIGSPASIGVLTPVTAIQIFGTLRVTAVGTVGISWGQDSAGAASTDMLRGSWFKVERVANLGVL